MTEQSNSSVQTVGPELASAPLLVLTDSIHPVGGVAAISRILAQPGHTGPVWLLATDAWSLVTGDNITAPLTAVPGLAYSLIFDGANWFPVGAP